MRHLLLALLALVFTISLTPGEATAQNNYRIKAGDTLRIEVLEDAQLNRNVLILPDGRFSFPFVGTILAGGRTLGQVERAITTGIASNFAVEPNVFVSVQRVVPGDPVFPTGPEAAPTLNVYYLGEVNAPGLKPVAPGTTFLQGLALNGGFTQFAATKRVQLRRTDARTGAQRLFTINYKALTRGAQLQNDIKLRDGDVILVPERRLFE